MIKGYRCFEIAQAFLGCAYYADYEALNKNCDGIIYGYSNVRNVNLTFSCEVFLKLFCF